MFEKGDGTEVWKQIRNGCRRRGWRIRRLNGIPLAGVWDTERITCGIFQIGWTAFPQRNKRNISPCFRNRSHGKDGRRMRITVRYLRMGISAFLCGSRPECRPAHVRGSYRRQQTGNSIPFACSGGINRPGTGALPKAVSVSGGWNQSSSDRAPIIIVVWNSL